MFKKFTSFLLGDEDEEKKTGDVFKTVLTLVPDLTFEDFDKQRDLLFWASLAGDVPMVEKCLSRRNIDIDRRVHLKRSAIMAAALRGDWTIYSLLKAKGADVTLVDKDGNNCLHLAAEGGKEPIVSDLLSQSLLEPDAKGLRGRTALHVAASKGYVDVVRMLVSAGADASAVDDEGNNCLHLSSAVGHLLMVQEIISWENFDVNLKGYMGQTALIQAVINDYLDVFGALIAHGADPTLRTDSNNDAIAVAIIKGHLPFLQKLIELNSVDVNSKGRHERTAIMISALLGKREEFEVLLSSEADTSIQDEFGNDCLMLAAYGGNVEILKSLLAMHTFDVNRRQENEATSLVAAITKGHKEAFDILVQEGADLTVTCFENNVLILACEGGNVDIVNNLISMQIFYINQRGQHGWTPFMVAVRYGHTDLVKILLQAGADFSLVDDDNNNCLILACIYGDLQLAELLLGLNDVDHKGKDGVTAVLASAHEGNEEVFMCIIGDGADLCEIDDSGRTCLIHASIGGNINIVNEMFHMGIEYGLDTQDNDGLTAAMAAALEGHAAIFDVLFDKGSNLELQDKDGDSCLMLACIGGNPSIVRKLLQTNSFDINAKGGKGWTPVMFASFYGNNEVLGALIDGGADICLLDDFGNNCLILAAANGHLSTAQRLLETRILNINYRGRGGCTAIHLAAHGGHTQLFYLLLEHGADLSVVDEIGANFIRYATPSIKSAVRDVPVVKNQLIAEVRGSFARSNSVRGSRRGSFIRRIE